MTSLHFITRAGIIVWDTLVQLSELPGGWIFPVCLSALFLLGVYLFVDLAIDAIRDLWIASHDERTKRANLALYKAQREYDQRRRLQAATRTGGQ